MIYILSCVWLDYMVQYFQCKNCVGSSPKTKKCVASFLVPVYKNDRYLMMPVIFSFLCRHIGKAGPWGPAFSVSKKSFRPAAQVFEALKKLQKLLISMVRDTLLGFPSHSGAAKILFATSFAFLKL